MYSTKIILSTMQMLGAKNDQGEAPADRDNSYPPSDDDIPF